MCGFVGYFGSSSDKDYRTPLANAIRILNHRGPDDEGIHMSNNYGVGFTRLAIQDLSKNGHQPMTNRDNTIYIMFNGEIYNAFKLKDDLIKRITDAGRKGIKISKNVFSELYQIL